MARLMALVPAAGGGTRFGATVPKQYASVEAILAAQAMEQNSR